MKYLGRTMRCLISAYQTLQSPLPPVFHVLILQTDCMPWYHARQRALLSCAPRARSTLATLGPSALTISFERGPLGFGFAWAASRGARLQQRERVGLGLPVHGARRRLRGQVALQRLAHLRGHRGRHRVLVLHAVRVERAARCVHLHRRHLGRGRQSPAAAAGTVVLAGVDPGQPGQWTVLDERMMPFRCCTGSPVLQACGHVHIHLGRLKRCVGGSVAAPA